MAIFLFWTATCSDFQKKLIDTITTNNFYLKFKEINENDMTFCCFSCLGRYFFRPTSMAALQLLTLAHWDELLDMRLWEVSFCLLSFLVKKSNIDHRYITTLMMISTNKPTEMTPWVKVTVVWLNLYFIWGICLRADHLASLTSNLLTAFWFFLFLRHIRDNIYLISFIVGCCFSVSLELAVH